MSQTKHTPGPWFRDGACGGMPWTIHVEQAFSQLGPSNGKVATAENIDGKFETRVANARLIAAAPDLLAACKLGLKVAESWIHDQLDGTKFLADALAELDSVRAAIAKATGQ